ncbi:MAG: hypothetical protein IRY87_28795 [Acetobacteraceae bacterium]|nr:hypothetical protein [Acetobacteraceae bacterium]
MRRAGLLLLFAMAACAQMTQPPPPPPPADLVAGAADPTRAAIMAVAAAFADRGENLAGRPAAAAQAAAQLEFIVEDLPRNPRWSAMPDSVQLDLLLARTELRDALGVAETAAPDVVIEALLRTARALRAGDRAAAAAALPAPLFRPGGARSVARLGELGPLPQVANATALAAQTVELFDLGGNLSSTQLPERTGGIGNITIPGNPAGY